MFRNSANDDQTELERTMNSSPEKSEFHRINLHGPWQAEVLQSELTSELVGKQLRAKIPFDWKSWLGSEFHGRISLVRSFGCPTNLRKDQKVWLVVEGAEFNGCGWLNDCELGDLQSGGAPLRVEIRDQLLRRNALRIDFSIPKQESSSPHRKFADGLFGGASLEIAQ